jgi:hypothetical protein
MTKLTPLAFALLLITCQMPPRNAEARPRSHFLCGDQPIIQTWNKSTDFKDGYSYFDGYDFYGANQEKGLLHRLFKSSDFMEKLNYRGRECRKLTDDEANALAEGTFIPPKQQMPPRSAEATEVPAQYRGQWCATSANSHSHYRCREAKEESDPYVSRNGIGWEENLCPVITVRPIAGGHRLRFQCDLHGLQKITVQRDARGRLTMKW